MLIVHITTRKLHVTWKIWILPSSCHSNVKFISSRHCLIILYIIFVAKRVLYRFTCCTLVTRISAITLRSLKKSKSLALLIIKIKNICWRTFYSKKLILLLQIFLSVKTFPSQHVRIVNPGSYDSELIIYSIEYLVFDWSCNGECINRL